MEALFEKTQRSQAGELWASGIFVCHAEGGNMLLKYIQTALEQAHYEIIEDQEPFYGEVPPLEGVWATGKTLEECRRNLAEAIEDWVLFSVAKGLPIPALGEATICLPERVPG